MKRTKLSNKGFNLTEQVKEVTGKGLSGRFLAVPFSVFRVDSDIWQNRKNQWLALGIQSEVGRGGNLLKMSDTILNLSKPKPNSWLTYNTDGDSFMAKVMEERGGGTSTFDPVLCELAYSWWCPKGGQIIDPFAGGSVRGIVASFMGYNYWGSELRPEQVEANIVQGKSIVPSHTPTWACGDAWHMLRDAPEADFIFSCPPYGNLEVYSDLEGDISNMEYVDFLGAYSKIVKHACRKLKNNRFACFVVSNFRDKKTGFYYDFVGDTIQAFAMAGMHFYNDAVLVTPVGSLSVRVGRQFQQNRKLGKLHQNVLVFFKGDVKQIRKDFNNEENKPTEG